jgi:hypothetical protein
MAGREFGEVAPELLVALERVVVENHAALHRDALGQAWSPPAAYRFIRYEDPDPIARLVEASLRLEEEWDALSARPGVAAARERAARREAERLREALAIARRLGYVGRAPELGEP